MVLRELHAGRGGRGGRRAIHAEGGDRKTDDRHRGSGNHTSGGDAAAGHDGRDLPPAKHSGRRGRPRLGNEVLQDTRLRRRRRSLRHGSGRGRPDIIRPPGLRRGGLASIRRYEDRLDLVGRPGMGPPFPGPRAGDGSAGAYTLESCAPGDHHAAAHGRLGCRRRRRGAKPGALRGHRERRHHHRDPRPVSADGIRGNLGIRQRHGHGRHRRLRQRIRSFDPHGLRPAGSGQRRLAGIRRDEGRVDPLRSPGVGPAEQILRPRHARHESGKRLGIRTYAQQPPAPGDHHAAAHGRLGCRRRRGGTHALRSRQDRRHHHRDPRPVLPCRHWRRHSHGRHRRLRQRLRAFNTHSLRPPGSGERRLAGL